jgi:hypothetical protein
MEDARVFVSHRGVPPSPRLTGSVEECIGKISLYFQTPGRLVSSFFAVTFSAELTGSYSIKRGP